MIITILFATALVIAAITSVMEQNEADRRQVLAGTSS